MKTKYFITIFHLSWKKGVTVPVMFILLLRNQTGP